MRMAVSNVGGNETRALIARLLVVLVTLLTLVGCESMDRAEAVREMNKGLEAYQLGRTLDGVRFLKEAANIDPAYAEPPYYLGQIYHMKLEELDNAERYYREALDRDPDNPQIAYRLGMVLTELNKWDDAIGMFRQAVQKKEDFAKAWFRLGLSQVHEKEYPAAVDSFMKAIETKPRMKMDEDDKGGLHYHALGDLYIKFGFYDKAAKVYANGIENIEGSPRLHIGHGVAQLKLERYPEAVNSFEEALSVDPGNASAIFNLAVAHMAMGKAEQAVEGFQKFTMRADPQKDMARVVAAEGFIQQIKEANKEDEEK